MSQTGDKKRLANWEVATDWQELMIPRRNRRSSIVRASDQLGPPNGMQTYQATMSHTENTTWIFYDSEYTN